MKKARCTAVLGAHVISLLVAPATSAEIKLKISTYVNGIRCIAARFTQVSKSGKAYSGNFWLLKHQKKNGNNSAKIRIDYLSGIEQKVFVDGGSVVVVDASGKEHRCSVANSPIYPLLCGRLDLEKVDCEVLENAREVVRIKLKGGAFGMDGLILVFSKYLETGNIKSLDAWITNDGVDEVVFSFDPEFLFINDESKLPHGVFDGEMLNIFEGKLSAKH